MKKSTSFFSLFVAIASLLLLPTGVKIAAAQSTAPAVPMTASCGSQTPIPCQRFPNVPTEAYEYLSVSSVSVTSTDNSSLSICGTSYANQAHYLLPNGEIQYYHCPHYDGMVFYDNFTYSELKVSNNGLPYGFSKLKSIQLNGERLAKLEAFKQVTCFDPPDPWKVGIIWKYKLDSSTEPFETGLSWKVYLPNGSEIKSGSGKTITLTDSDRNNLANSKSVTIKFYVDYWTKNKASKVNSLVSEITLSPLPTLVSHQEYALNDNGEKSQVFGKTPIGTSANSANIVSVPLINCKTRGLELEFGNSVPADGASVEVVTNSGKVYWATSIGSTDPDSRKLLAKFLAPNSYFELPSTVTVKTSIGQYKYVISGYTDDNYYERLSAPTYAERPRTAAGYDFCSGNVQISIDKGDWNSIAIPQEQATYNDPYYTVAKGRSSVTVEATYGYCKRVETLSNIPVPIRPALPIINGDLLLCSGSTATQITHTNPEQGIVYQLKRNGVDYGSSWAYVSGGHSENLPAGAYELTATQPGSTDCMQSYAFNIIKADKFGLKFHEGNVQYCGSNNDNINLFDLVINGEDSLKGKSYQWQIKQGGNTIPNAILHDSFLRLSLLTAGSYEAVLKVSQGVCDTTMSKAIWVLPSLNIPKENLRFLRLYEGLSGSARLEGFTILSASIQVYRINTNSYPDITKENFVGAVPVTIRTESSATATPAPVISKLSWNSPVFDNDDANYYFTLDLMPTEGCPIQKGYIAWNEDRNFYIHEYPENGMPSQVSTMQTQEVEEPIVASAVADEIPAIAQTTAFVKQFTATLAPTAAGGGEHTRLQITASEGGQAIVRITPVNGGAVQTRNVNLHSGYNEVDLTYLRPSFGWYAVHITYPDGTYEVLQGLVK